jgi:uncharacterized protein involved in exopolysaccharide biosynthesis
MTAREQIIRLVYLSLDVFYKRIRVFLVPFIILPIFTIGLSMMGTKQYVNHATILIEESALLNPFLDDLSFSFELNERIDALRTLVISRKVLRRIALENGLFTEDSSSFKQEAIQQKLSESISITLVGDELIKVHFKWDKPAQMKVILESIVEEVIKRLLAPTKTSLDTSELFFAEQLDVLRIELESAETLLADYKAMNSAVLPQLFTTNRETLEDIEKQKQMKLVEFSGVKARLESLSAKLGKANPVLGLLEEKIVRIESKLALLRTRYTEKHSRIKSLVRESSKLREKQQEIMESNTTLDGVDMESLWQIANAMPVGVEAGEQSLLVSQIAALQEANNQYAQVKQEMDMLQSQADMLSGRLAQTSEVEKHLYKLQRDYDVKADLYKEMLSRYEMAKVTGKLVRYEGPDKIKQIERAYSPTQPIGTPLSITIILGVVLGLLSGIGFVFIAAILDNRLRDLRSIEKLIAQPILSVLPIIDSSIPDRDDSFHSAIAHDKL